MRVSRLVIPLLAVLVASSAALAQRRVVGRVADQGTGEPLPGASVVVVGTNIGAITGDNGAFVLRAPDGSIALLVRRIGYKRVNVTVGPSDSVVTVTMQRDVLQLETQVITGAATSVAKRNAANDVATVTADQLTNAPSPSIESALSGKIAGAQVIANSGAPGGGNQIRLRGVTSVFGSADPLYVVDGVIISNDAIQPGTNAITAAARSSNASNQDNGVNRIADLNPNDIESIEVLKGASASAIYGSKASNGVVIIRTKSGAGLGGTGKPVVDFIQRVGTRGLNRKNGLRKFKLADAYTRGTAVGLDSATILQSYNSCGGFCDYEEQLFGEHPLNYETNLSVRGANSGTSYFASLLNMYDGGIQQNTGYRKQGVRLNLTQTVTPKLSVQFNNNVVRSLTRRGISNNDNVNITPYFVMAFTPSFWDLRPKNGVYPTNPFVGNPGTNPFQNAALIQTPDEVWRLISAASATYSVFAHDRSSLSVKLDGGADRFSEQVNVVSPRTLYFEGNDGLPGTVTSLSATEILANWNLGAIHTWTPESRNWLATTSAGLQRAISERRSTNAVGRDVLLGQENVDRAAAISIFADHQKQRGLAAYAQEELLGRDERLLATVGLRAERNTANGDDGKYYTFPKASVSYRFLTPTLLNHWLLRVDEIKPRLAVGQSGNLPLPIEKYSPALTATYAGQNGVTPGRVLGDPNIKPETQTEIEGGFDASMFDGKASINFTLYQKTINDLILIFARAPSTGAEAQIRNGGSIRNRGAETMLAITPPTHLSFGGSAVQWISRTTFAKNVGIVTALPVPAYIVERDFTGQRVAFGAGYGIARLEKGKKVTQIVASCNNGAAVCVAGDAAPAFNMGFSNELNWKSWRASTVLDWQNGGSLVDVSQDVFDAFATSPDKADGGAARATENDGKGNHQYVYKAGFWKLRELSVAYTLPPNLVNTIFQGRAATARLEFSGRNLFTWSSYPGVDPEVSNFGNQSLSRFVDLAPFPPSRTFYFSLAASF